MQTDFSELSPELMLDAIEAQGFISNGQFIALNSYENRVFQVGIEDANPLIAKFYRPERWSNEQIIEEHQYSQALQDSDIPAVAALSINNNTLFEYCGYRFSLFPRHGGRAPELDNLDNLEILGRTLGRIHLEGQASNFQHRPTIDTQSYGYEAADFLCQGFIPDFRVDEYRQMTTEILEIIDEKFANTPAKQRIRTHGDCHPGNILWRDDKPNFVDFDDARNAHAIQDIWMLLSGERHEQQQQLFALIDGYEQMREFNMAELGLIESYRSLRQIHYAAWLAKRWDDPAFPMAFPWFNTESYWIQHINGLREQLFALNAPSILLQPL